MGYTEDKTNLFLSNLVINKKSQGNLFAEKPIFSSNGNSLIVSSGRSCHLYNTQTGNHVRELFQCADEIVSYQLHPVESSQVIAITENGEVYVYNLTTNELEYSINLELSSKTLGKQSLPKFTSEVGEEDFDWSKQSVESLQDRKFLYAEVKPYQGNDSEVLVWATWCLNDEVLSHLSVFSFADGKQLRQISLRKVGLVKRYQSFVTGCVQGLDVFVGSCGDFLYVAHFDKKKSYVYSSRKHYIGHSKGISCLAFHPGECCLATGDTLGRIIIWKNIFDKHPLKDFLHWHTLPVRDLAFSKFGNYLFSGGEENVLVKWSLTSRNREFLPRLSSVIHHLSVASDSALLSVSTTDNRILIINFNFKSISTIQHFSTWSTLKQSTNRNVFTIDPRTDSLVLNGKTGHIQFLSIKDSGKFMYTFDVTNRNFVTSDSSSVIENTEVTHAKFSKNGKWLVTAESRSEGLYKDTRMKFWVYCEKESLFSLHTSVELPHEDYAIHCLELSSDEKVATTGADRKFRLWTTFECQQVNRVKEIWSVLSVNKYRNLPCRAIDFSKDASLIAVTFGCVLTVWETNTAEIKCSLSAPFKKDELKVCKFGNSELSHLVVTGTDYNVSCWNTITLSMTWTVPLNLSLLISDPFSIYMSAFSTDNSLIVFNPGSPSADLLLKSVSSCPVVAAHTAAAGVGRFCLYFLTSGQDLFCLEDGEKTSASVYGSDVARVITPYTAQLAKIQNRTEGNNRSVVPLNKNNQLSVSNLLHAPAHTLPNPSLLCSDVLKGLLVYCHEKPLTGGDKKKVENAVEGGKSSSVSVEENLSRIEAKLTNIVKTIFV